MRYRRYFTLVELLVAMFLGLIIISLAFYVFHGASTATERGMRMVMLHQRAEAIMAMLADDLENMHPGCAMHLSGTTQLTFMRELRGLDADLDGQDEQAFDLAWVKWEWDNTHKKLLRGVKLPDVSGTTRDNDNGVVPSQGTVQAPTGMETVLADGISAFSITVTTRSGGSVGTWSGIDINDTGNDLTRPGRVKVAFTISVGSDKGKMEQSFSETYVLPGGE